MSFLDSVETYFQTRNCIYSRSADHLTSTIALEGKVFVMVFSEGGDPLVGLVTLAAGLQVPDAQDADMQKLAKQLDDASWHAGLLYSSDFKTLTATGHLFLDDLQVADRDVRWVIGEAAEVLVKMVIKMQVLLDGGSLADAIATDLPDEFTATISPGPE